MSAAAKKVNECDAMSCSISAYVDGELDPGHAADTEAHVLSCGACAEKVALLRAMRASLKRTSSARPCPAALRDRLTAAMARESARREEHQGARRETDEALSPKLIRLKYAVGLAAAAGVVLAMGMTRNAAQTSTSLTASAADTASAVSIDKLLDDLVSLHANPIPPETTNPEDLRNWDPLVGVPVRKPAFQPFGGNFHGARVLATADRRAAMLQYTVLGGHRVTVYVFNPRDMPMQATQLAPRTVHHRPVLVGKMRGYSVAAAEQSGVGYALASDVDEDETSQMVVAAVAP